MAYGVTSAGFVIKPYQAIQAELQAAYQAIFGSDLDVSVQSIAGQFINEQALEQSTLWELAQFIYSGFNPDSAVGTALDDVCARVNVSRIAATPSAVVMVLYGAAGTVIPTNHLVAQAGTNLQLACSAGITLAASIALDITISVKTVLNAQLYTVTLKGVGYTYTSDGTATAIEIIAGLKAAMGTITGLTITSPTSTTIRVIATDGETSFTAVVDANLQFAILGCPANYAAVIPGSVSFPANSITLIVNAVSGLNSVNNILPAVAGNNLETDDVLRVRRSLAVNALGKGTDGAIAQNLLQNVAGVTSAYVYSNRTDFVDGSGRPAHSFEAVVTGGTDADVAAMIWATMPSGIASYGLSSSVVVDSQGDNQTIYFSRPENVYIWLQVALSFYSEEQFPVNGIAAVAAAIVAWSLHEYIAGKDVILQRILSPIYTIAGISAAVITIATETDPLITPGPGDYGSANIALTTRQFAVFDLTRISVTP